MKFPAYKEWSLSEIMVARDCAIQMAEHRTREGNAESARLWWSRADHYQFIIENRD